MGSVKLCFRCGIFPRTKKSYCDDCDRLLKRQWYEDKLASKEAQPLKSRKPVNDEMEIFITWQEWRTRYNRRIVALEKVGFNYMENDNKALEVLHQLRMGFRNGDAVMIQQGINKGSEVDWTKARKIERFAWDSFFETFNSGNNESDQIRP